MDPQASRYQRSDLTEKPNEIGDFRWFSIVFSRVQIRDSCGITVGVGQQAQISKLSVIVPLHVVQKMAAGL
jgi:hypothetical protein